MVTLGIGAKKNTSFIEVGQLRRVVVWQAGVCSGSLGFRVYRLLDLGQLTLFLRLGLQVWGLGSLGFRGFTVFRVSLQSSLALDRS